MPVGVTNIYIYSNDGSTQLASFGCGFTAVEVKDTGFYQYTYSGSGTFLGLATSANATTPTYAVGDEIPLSLRGDDLNLYIVEEAASGVLIKYKGETIDTLASGESIMLHTTDKKLTGDIEVIAPAESGGGSGSGVDGGYSVTFMSADAPHTVYSVTPEQAINQPDKPKITGQVFLGWYTEENGGGDLVTFPYTPTGDTILYANYMTPVILGFTGLTASSGDLTLTDDIAGFAKYTTTEDGTNINVHNQLDSVFPYNQIEEFTDGDGNVFVKYPKFWMKWVTNSAGEIDGWKISNAQADDEYFIPDCFLNADGTTYNDYFALGKYEGSGSSSKMYSKSGATCLVSITRATARTAARAYGTSGNYYNGYQQEDISMLTAYNFLCMMYYRTANIQKVYGGRTSSVTAWSSAAATGSCDGLSGMNGWSTTTDCVKMLGIENPFGNIYKWIDGIWFSSATVYYHRLPHNFADSTSLALSLGFSRPTSGAYISAFKAGTSAATKSCVYASAANGSADTYCGDYQFSGGTVLAVGGDWDYASNAGLWYLFGNYDASFSDSDIGARLSFRPL